MKSIPSMKNNEQNNPDGDELEYVTSRAIGA